MPIYTVEIRYKDNRVGEAAVTEEELFNFTWSLQQSDFVKQFRFQDGFMPKTFGFGNMDKWVGKFTWKAKETPDPKSVDDYLKGVDKT